MDRREALITAGRTRLRPIMMTTPAMIFGMLPLFFALGEGAEMRAPMARAVVGGLITSTLLTLIVVPVVYTHPRRHGRLAVRRRKKPARRGGRGGGAGAGRGSPAGAPAVAASAPGCAALAVGRCAQAAAAAPAAPRQRGPRSR